MNYDFSTIIDRSGTYSMKWDVAEGELPMWVADMEFQAAPEIRAAICEAGGARCLRLYRAAGGVV